VKPTKLNRLLLKRNCFI